MCGPLLACQIHFLLQMASGMKQKTQQSTAVKSQIQFDFENKPDLGLLLIKRGIQLFLIESLSTTGSNQSAMPITVIS